MIWISDVCDKRTGADRECVTEIPVDEPQPALPKIPILSLWFSDKVIYLQGNSLPFGDKRWGVR
jgi:hypothetical protein